ncbi:MAG TPA: hypothetical protein VGR62_19560 [Candidatus Binatia bacterium]|jgi:hypothetical protein|nr:hypothetical protein [Candidatus Binatia bacterium]
MRVLLLTAFLLAALPRRAPAIVLGGGLADTDCTVAFGGVDATAGMSGVVCRDGDTCDLDGIVNGACRFDVGVCRAVEDPGCNPRSVTRVEVEGLALEVPDLAGDAGVCGEPTSVTLPTASAVGVTMLARDGDEPRDVDYLNVCCIDETRPLDAARCALHVDLALAGCTTRIPRKGVRAFTKARKLVEQAWSQGGSTRLVARARRQLARVQSVGQRLSDRDRCGNTLGLLARHALDVL